MLEQQIDGLNTYLFKMNKNDEFINKLEIMIKANMSPWVTTNEEIKFIDSLRKLTPRFKGLDIRVLIWSLSEGIFDYTDYLTKNESGKYGKRKSIKPNSNIDDLFIHDSKISNQFNSTIYEQLIEFVLISPEPTIYVIKDIHYVLEERNSKYNERLRKTRDLIQSLRTTNSWIIFTSQNSEVPLDLEKDVHALDMPLPDEKEISNLLDTAIRGFSKVTNNKIDIEDILKEQITFNLLGLTEVEISEVLTYTFVKNTGLNQKCLSDIKEIKRQIVEKSGALEFISIQNEVQIGGHERFKNYVEERSLYLNQKYRDAFKLTPPKGVLLVGIPGSGKSLFARYIGYKWNIPLIRLDMGSVYGQFLGQSEEKLRNALKITEANAPCILWIDEIEKALGGVSSSESSTTHRIFGKLLTWMAERKEMIFLYCTANNIKSIPLEFQRAGRIDSIWWGDVPLEEDCKDIFKIHCKSNNINLSEEDFDILAKTAYKKEMTGAEIEHAILESCYRTAILNYKNEKINNNFLFVKCNIILEVMNEIRTYAQSNINILKKNRIEALSKYEFTNNKSKQIAEKIAGDIQSIKSEFE